jgi:hypothetical protein
LGVSFLHKTPALAAGVALLLMIMLWARPALASDPLPGDATTPPANINIVLYYNIFSKAGVLEPPHGDGYTHDTHVSLDIQALRYIRTFNAGGMLSGVQIVQPYVSFIGNQQLGIPHYGPGHFNLTASGGFLQPSLGAFIFPVARPASGTYFVVGFWFAPPIGHYDKTANISVTQNLWIGELEAGGHQTLLGNPAAQNLSVELWGEGYFYGSNGNATLAGIGGTAPARLSQQPSGEIRVYLPYEFFPLTRAAVIPGFYQSFGGKQVYTLADGTKLDAGTRTQETQLRFMVSSYLSQHWQILLNAQYDLAAHGGPLNRDLELRVGAIF